MVNERRGLVSVFALYLLLTAGYSLLMPVWEAPDEPAHYHLAWHRLTYGEDPPPEMNYEFHQPRGFYIVAMGVLRALNEVDPELTRFRRPEEYIFNIRKPERRFNWTDENYDFYWGVYVLRWVNIIFGGIALWLNWKTFRLIASSSLALAALALAALTPQYLHIMSAVNNDALGTLAGALLFYLTVRAVREPSTWLGLFSIVLGLILPLLTKLSVLPVSAAALLAIFWKWVCGQAQKRWLFSAAIVLLVGAGMMYVFFPGAIQTAIGEIEWRLSNFRENAWTSEYIKFITSQIVWTYWGKVGWLAVGLPGWMIYALTGLGLTGMGLHAYRLLGSGTRHPDDRLWIVVWMVALLVTLAVFRNGLTTRATQGRLLFPAIGALSLLMVAGWHGIVPFRAQRHLPALIILILLFCNLYLWLTGVVPVYYQPFLD
jgi:hypothetical protein